MLYGGWIALNPCAELLQLLLQQLRNLPPLQVGRNRLHDRRKQPLAALGVSIGPLKGIEVRDFGLKSDFSHFCIDFNEFPNNWFVIFVSN